VPDRRVVDLEDRPRVVAEVAKEPEIEAHPLGDAAGRERLVGRRQTLRGALDGGSARLAGPFQDLASAPDGREAKQRLPRIRSDGQVADVGLQPHEVVRRQPGQETSPGVAVHPELVEELAVEVGVAQPDHGSGQPRGVERRAQDLDRLGGPLRRLGADQLHAGLCELPHLPALGADRAIGVADVPEPERRLVVRKAGGDQARDRDRHVGPHREELSPLVEEPVGGRGAALVTARQHLVVLDRRRRHLAVAEALEDAGKRGLQAAKLAHLVGQDVPGAWGDSMGHC
jgi:hypothetical protein